MTWCHFVFLFSILRQRAWKAPATQLSTGCTSHACGSFAIRVSYSIEAKRKNGRKSAPASFPICPPSFAKESHLREFFFLFLATKSQVGGRQREKLVANGELATGNFERCIEI